MVPGRSLQHRAGLDSCINDSIGVVHVQVDGDPSGSGGALPISGNASESNVRYGSQAAKRLPTTRPDGCGSCHLLVGFVEPPNSPDAEAAGSLDALAEKATEPRVIGMTRGSNSKSIKLCFPRFQTIMAHHVRRC